MLALNKLFEEWAHVSAEVFERARSTYAPRGLQVVKALEFHPLFCQPDGNRETLAWQSRLVDLRECTLVVMGFFIELESLDTARFDFIPYDPGISIFGLTFQNSSSPTDQLDTLSHAIPMVFAIRHATIPQLRLSINTPESFYDLRFNTLQLLSKAIGRHVALCPIGLCSLPPRPSSYLSDRQLIESMVLFDGPQPFKEHYTTWENCYLMVLATIFWTDLHSIHWRAVLYENNLIHVSIRRAHVYLKHLQGKESWGTDGELRSTYNNICRVLLPAWENVLMAADKEGDRRLVHQAINAEMMFCLEHMSCFGEPRLTGELSVYGHHATFLS